MKDPTESQKAVQQVSISTGNPRKTRTFRPYPGGIVAEPAAGLVIGATPAVQNADQVFPPIVPGPITIENRGGAIGTGLPVQLIFWGSAWNLPSTNPGLGAIAGAVQSILSGPWFSGLRQYGIRRCNFGGSMVVTNPGPPATYQDDDVQSLIWALIDDNKFPEPDEPGGRNLYMVFMPPGTTYGPGGIRGKHLVASDTDLPADIDHAWVGLIVASTSLGAITSAFSHELAEMCTDPESDAWVVNGNQEIGDVCNILDGQLNGVNVESYWSAADHACLIPTAYSVRRMLLWSGRSLGTKGLRSLEDPIPSLNQLLIDL
jgi:hypothetical protein